MKRVPSKQRNFVIHRERDRAALKRLALMLLSGLVLAGGFVYAAGQHFSALRFGYEGEKLRSERTRLLEEQHRLLLEREVAATPARLEIAARELGMHPVQSAQVDPAKRAKRTLATAAPALIASPVPTGVIAETQ
ncbi:MAG TPA: cell division protein FtsL [Pyrinomonadaceae bacterium]|jgi:cell division protein FtsL